MEILLKSKMPLKVYLKMPVSRDQEGVDVCVCVLLVEKDSDISALGK